jgi:hypothetical protein
MGNLRKRLTSCEYLQGCGMAVCSRFALANGRCCVGTAGVCICCVCRACAGFEQAPAMVRVPVQAAAVSGDRNMANVKQLRLRLASVQCLKSTVSIDLI